MLLAYGGILTALSLVSLLLGTFLSINTLTFLCISSFFIGVMYIEGGIKYSVITFISVSVLSFFLPVDKKMSMAFIAFFGYYPILKALIEKFKNIKLELIVKLVLFSVISVLGIFLFKLFISFNGIKFPYAVTIILGILFLFIFDYALGVLFTIYFKYIRDKIRRN